MAKIIINAVYAHDQPTGLGVYTYELVKEILGQSDGEVIAYSASKELKELYPSRVRTTSGFISPQLGFKGHLLRNLWEQTYLPVRTITDGGSLLHSTVPEGPVFSPFLKQIITFHDIIPIKFPEYSPKFKYYFYYLIPFLIRASKGIICDSENTKKDIEDYYNIRKKPIFVVHPGIDNKKFTPREKGLSRRKYGLNRYICHVGEMRPYKNLERAIEAFGRLNLKDYEFVLVGNKTSFYHSQLERFIKGLRLEDRVKFLGYVPNKDLPHIYSDAAVLVFPSLYEGFGFPPLEAMSCGCPVIASTAASIPEVCGKAAYYVNPYSISSIEEGLHKVLSDEGLRSRLILNGLERAKLFSWGNAAKKIIDIYEKILD